jgi:hypothetical protein
MLLLFEAAFDVMTDRAVVLPTRIFTPPPFPYGEYRKTEPRPGWLSTSMRPRCSATMP